MAEEQTTETFQVAYFGKDPNIHSMDVEELGPALAAFGQLIRAANDELNAKRANVKVLVGSEFEHKCFSINFEVVQTLIDSVQGLLADDAKVQHIKDILKVLGITTTGVGVAAGGLFAYLKWRKGRTIEKVVESPNAVVIKVQGDNNTFNIDKSVFKLSQNIQVLRAVDSALAPVEHGEEQSIEFRETDKKKGLVLSADDVKAIVSSVAADPKPIVVEGETKPKTITGTLYVYGPVFDAKAPNWRFKYKGKPVYADVRETSIAADAVKRGGSFVNDRYKVKMEVTEPKTDDGDAHYKIVEVLEFTEAEQQISLPLKKRRARGGRAAKRS